MTRDRSRPRTRAWSSPCRRLCAAARAPLIARLDADDTAHRERLERQVRSFQDPAVVLCATAYRRVRRDGALIRESHPPAAHAAMAAALLDGNRICHSSVMFRLDAARSVGGYRAEWYPVEDYDLWLRLMEVGRYTGIDEPLVDYLENEAGVSSTNTGLQGARLDERRAQYALVSVLNASGRPQVPPTPWRRPGDGCTSDCSRAGASTRMASTPSATRWRSAGRARSVAPPGADAGGANARMARPSEAEPPDDPATPLPEHSADPLVP